MDRTGSNPESVVKQLKEKLGCDAVLMQISIGREEKFEGVIDLVTMKAIYFDGANGEKVREEAIPANLQKEAEAARHHMLESLSMYSDKLMEMLLSEEEITEELIHDIIRQAVIEQEFTPVYLGTAYRNKGVQPLLDAITRYLPSPLAAEVNGKEPNDQAKLVHLEPNPDKPFVGMAFKI